MPRWGIPYGERLLDLDAVFGRQARRVLDIGFGDGDALMSAAANYPELDYVGVEVHEPGIGHLLVLLQRGGLENVRIIDRDAVDVIEHMFPPTSFAAVKLLFPDPWPKKRHHKRRLIQPDFIASLAGILEPQGLLHIATDWSNYAEHTLEVLDESSCFEAIQPESLADPALVFRAPTKFERRGRRLGHEVFDFYFSKCGSGT